MSLILVCNYRENTSLSSIIIINVFSVIIIAFQNYNQTVYTNFYSKTISYIYRLSTLTFCRLLFLNLNYEGLQQKEAHRQKTHKMAEKGRKKAEERIQEEKIKSQQRELTRKRDDIEEDKKKKLRSIKQEKAAEGRRKETKQRIQEYRKQKSEMAKKEEERKKSLEKIENDEKRNKKQRARGAFKN